MTIGVVKPRKRTLNASPNLRRQDSRKEIGRSSQRVVCSAGGAEGPGGSSLIAPSRVAGSPRSRDGGLQPARHERARDRPEGRAPRLPEGQVGGRDLGLALGRAQTEEPVREGRRVLAQRAAGVAL